MNTLIIGYGSIGSRHARLLHELEQNVSVVSHHASKSAMNLPVKFYRELSDSLIREHDYIVIANKTHEHFPTLLRLLEAGFTGKILIEKPLFGSVHALPDVNNAQIFVAYNFRFHPVIQRLRELLIGQEFVSVQGRVGQYLPDWRPNGDYRTHYSAHRNEGGGVLNDLSHELDYMSWLFGDWQRLTALGGKYSDLEIDSDDVFSFLWSSSHCPILSLEINYLDRTLRREIIVNTKEFTVKADVPGNRLWLNSTLEEFSGGRDVSYRAQHEALLANDNSTICTLREGLNIMGMIEAARTATQENRWVHRHLNKAEDNIT